MVTLYTSHCPRCKVFENLLKTKKIEYNTVDDEKIYLPIADEHDIMSMPFASVDGTIMNHKQFQDYIVQR